MEAKYNSTKPVISKNHTLEQDIRPIGERRYKWQRIKKLSDTCYAFLDGYRGIQTDESPIPNEPVSLCAGSWEPPLREGPAMYRCAVCDQSAGAKRQVPMEQIRGGRTAEYMVREHYPRGVKPNTRGKSPRKMSAVEAIH